MSYLEIVKLALKERSINRCAKEWGMEQVTLNRYATGKRLPDYLTAKKIAEEAGISGDEMLKILAEEEANRKGKKTKISTSFDWLLRSAKLGYMRVTA